MTHGFSLLELMVTLSIISILTLVGYPSYHYQLAKSHRYLAEIALAELAQNPEKELTQTIKGYVLEKRSSDETHFTIKAIPQAEQLRWDACGTLSLSSEGKTEGLQKNCWN